MRLKKLIKMLQSTERIWGNIEVVGETCEGEEGDVHLYDGRDKAGCVTQVIIQVEEKPS